MFSGGGLAWADAAMKRGEFVVTPAPAGTWPDLTGLSCRFEEIPSKHGLIVSMLIIPARDADPAVFRALIESIVMLIDQNPNAGGPVPSDVPQMRWPPQGVALEVCAKPGDKRLRRLSVLAWTLLYFLIMRTGVRVGGFVPKKYLRQVVENSDFRKYDDGLRMILDCTPALADQLESQLKAASGTALYGLHRQDAAMMTCFTPSPMRSDHVHFVDGARGGYALAATALKAGSGDIAGASRRT